MTVAGQVMLVQPVYRRPDLSSERFHYHWRQVHGPKAARIALLKSYVQNHCIEHELAGFNRLGCDGVVEVVMDGVDSAAALPDDPEYLAGAGPDEKNFLDIDRSVGFLTVERRLLSDETPMAAARAILLLRKADDIDDAGLLARSVTWAERVASSGGLCGLSLASVLGEPQERPFDLVVLLTWSDVAALERHWATTKMRGEVEALRAFTEPADSFGVLVNPQRIV